MKDYKRLKADLLIEVGLEVFQLNEFESSVMKEDRQKMFRSFFGVTFLFSIYLGKINVDKEIIPSF